MLYAATARACKAMGYARIQTYILEEESGVSLKAAGWINDHTTAGGSVYPHKDRWRVSVSLGSDGHGKRVRKEWQCRTYKAAERKIEDVQKRLRSGLPPEDSKVTVAVYTGEWLRAVKGSVKDTTWDQYRHLARHLTTEFGHLPLARVGPPDLRRLIQRRQGQGYASRTIRGILDVFRMMSKMAMSDGILTRNVAELVQRPKLEQAEPRHFTAEQARRFLDATKADELGSLFAVALGTGLRRGELLGLTWRDVDPDLVAVRVRRSKTSAGVRTVPLPDFARTALLRLDRGPGPIWPVSPSWVSHRLPVLCEAAGLPRMHFHSLRHTAASLLLAEGVDPFTIQSLLGHSRVAMTAHYARAEEKGKREAMEKLGRAVG